MSKIKNPLESENLGNFYLHKLYDTEKEFAKSTTKYSQDALEDLGLMEVKEQIYKKGIEAKKFYLYYVSGITFTFADLVGAEEPTPRFVLNMNKRLMTLKLKTNPEKIIQISKKLFGDAKLKSIIKTMYLTARDYTIEFNKSEIINSMYAFVDSLKVDSKHLSHRKRLQEEKKLELIKERIKNFKK